MHKNQALTRKQVIAMTGRPVCVVLKNGNYYVGRIQGVENGQLVLSGYQAKGKYRPALSRSRRVSKKANVSGLFGLGSLLGGAGGIGAGGIGAGGAAAGAQPGGGGLLGGLGGIGGFMQFFSKAWPAVRMGMGMVRTIMPMFGGGKT
ncbi:hypothetical protein [Cohnella terricola]|uniref:Uncharacterized protein n=1 Tax=Cohnella terricola TaxID=1289167 RepID=A0A559JQ38_9BACL|nr:hypothetical protein [Cohnella terricola]TVY01991.1 hypothetical protein FPZ45_05980 [Cohnella terricola]